MTKEVADYMNTEVEKVYDMPALQVLGARIVMEAKYELDKMHR